MHSVVQKNWLYRKAGAWRSLRRRAQARRPATHSRRRLGVASLDPFAPLQSNPRSWVVSRARRRAKRCAAETGRCGHNPWRCRFCSASLRAALRPGNARSIDWLKPGVFHHFRPAPRLRSDEPAELGRQGFRGLHGQLCEAGSNCVGLKRLMDSLMETANGIGRRAGWNNEAEPLHAFQSRIARFFERGHIRKGSAAAGSRGDEGS